MTRALTLAALLFDTTVGIAADDSRKFLKDLEGIYSPVSMTRSGEPAPKEFMDTVSFSIKSDTLAVKFKKGANEEDKSATLVVDVAQKPIAIDMTPKDGPDAGKPMLGIIKVEKDTVTICWADRGDKAERPKEFTSTKDNKQFLIVMKKK